MLDFLAGVPGKLKTLSDRLNATWASKLDNLDTRYTSTRAGYLDNLSAGAPALAANYTSTRAGYLDKLNVTGNVAREETPLLDTPIASGVITGGQLVYDYTPTNPGPGFAIHSNNTTSYVDAVNYTGAGVVEFAAEMCSGGVGGGTIEVLIDGVSVNTKSGSLTAGRGLIVAIGGAGEVRYYDGAAIKNMPVYMLTTIPFKTSLQIRHKADGGSTTVICHYKYWKTA